MSTLHNPLLLAALRGPSGRLELTLRLAQEKAEREAQLAIIVTSPSPLDRVIASTALGMITPRRAEEIISARPGMVEAAAALGAQIATSTGLHVDGGAIDHLAIGQVAGGNIVTINIYTTEVP